MESAGILRVLDDDDNRKRLTAANHTVK